MKRLLFDPDLRRKLWPFAAALLSLTFFLLAMPPGYLVAVAFITWVPLLVLLQSGKLGRAVIAWGGTTFVCWFLSTLALAQYPVLAFDQPRWLALLMLASHAIWCAIPYALAAWGTGWLIRNRQSLGQVTAPFLFATLATQWPSAFPGGLYLALYKMPWAYGWAEFGGAWTLSLWLFAINWAVTLTISGWWKSRRFPWKPAATVVVLALIFNLLGFWRYQTWVKREENALAEGRFLRVALIQPAFPPRNAERGGLPFPPDYSREDLMIIPISRAAVQASPNLDLVVWPEFPLRIDYLTNPETRGFIDGWRAEAEVPLMFCSLEFIDEGTASLAHYLGAHAEEPVSRAKKRLIPMSEYLPLEHQFPFLRRWFPQINRLEPGQNYTPIEGPNGLLLAPLVCYDDMFPAVANHWKANGAGLLIALSDDSWFGNSRIQAIRLASGMLNAIETGLPMVRVGNANHTLAVLPSGRLLGQGEIADYHEGFLVIHLPLFK